MGTKEKITKLTEKDGQDNVGDERTQILIARGMRLLYANIRVKLLAKGVDIGEFDLDQ